LGVKKNFLDKNKNNRYNTQSDVGGKMKKPGRGFVLFFTLFALMFGTSLFISAQDPTPQTGTLMGFVYKDDGKKPMKGVQIILEPHPEKVEGQLDQYESALTEDDGAYRIDNLPAGMYMVQIRHKDKEYKVKKLDVIVTITAQKENIVSFSLKKQKTLAYILIPGTATAALLGATLFTPTPEPEQSPTTR